MHNALFHLISRGKILPGGWGFPPASGDLVPPACGIRSALMFMEDLDGAAQLCRFYHGILRAVPFVAQEVVDGGQEFYEPADVYKQAITSEITFLPEPVARDLGVDWIPGFETKSLTGRFILAAGEASLELGGITRSIPLAVYNSYLVPGFPAEMGVRCAIAGDTDDGDYTISFRARSFDHDSILKEVASYDRELRRAGLLDSFTVVPFPWQKLAVAWLAVHRLEANE